MDLTLLTNRKYMSIAIVVAAAVLLWLVFSPATTSVETAVAKRQPLIVTIDAEGKTRVKNKYTVTAPVSGKMNRIALNEGDNIPRDFVITEIDPNPPMPRPPSELAGRPNPYTFKVYSPAAGKILSVADKSERYVQAGTPLVEIGDPTNIELVVDVLSTDAVQVHSGSTVLIDRSDSGDPFRARVRVVEPQAVTKISALGVEEKRVDIVADFIDQKPAFGDNFRMDARIVVWQADDVLTVPNSSLFRVGENWNVFVLSGRKAVLRAVSVGHRSSSDAEIIGGLNEGEKVIIHPPSSISDGSRVSPE
jgi:multidrug efflux pump subunit AcrA (membrane-fusion protein)